MLKKQTIWYCGTSLNSHIIYLFSIGPLQSVCGSQMIKWVKPGGNVLFGEYQTDTWEFLYQK